VAGRGSYWRRALNRGIIYLGALRNSYWVAIAFAVPGVFTSLVRGGGFNRAGEAKEK
jgi:hypothetical protein